MFVLVISKVSLLMILNAIILQFWLIYAKRRRGLFSWSF